MRKIENIQDNENHSLRIRVFKELEENILNGKFQPGESLIETKLSAELGVSRTPVREAIRQLELEGLVKTVPNRGTVVLGISTKDIEDIYTIRMLIEGLAARWAAKEITAEEIAKLREIVELSEFYTQKGDMKQLQKLDSKFHELIYEACKSNPLRHTLSGFHHYIKRARGTSFQAPGRAMKALDEHKSILKAIIDRDGEKAEQLICQHVKNARANVLTNR